MKYVNPFLEELVAKLQTYDYHISSSRTKPESGHNEAVEMSWRKDVKIARTVPLGFMKVFSGEELRWGTGLRLRGCT